MPNSTVIKWLHRALTALLLLIVVGYATIHYYASQPPDDELYNTASHAVAKLSSIHFDPNTRPRRADNYRWMTAFLRQFYNQDKKDRANSLTQVQAEQRVKVFSECPTEPFRPEAQTSHIVSQVYSADRPKEQSQILLESATATYCIERFESKEKRRENKGSLRDLCLLRLISHLT